MNITQFDALLEKRDRAEPVCLLTRTDPKMNTGGRLNAEGLYPNRFMAPDKTSRVAKIGWQQVWIGVSYESAVNRQRDREATAAGADSFESFKAEELWNGYGQRVDGSRYVAANVNEKSDSFGRLYLVVKRNNDSKHPLHPSMMGVRYVWKESGNELTDAELDEMNEYVKAPSTSKTQEVDRPVFWATIELCNIEYIRIAGKDHTLEINRDDYSDFVEIV